jgi:hypothetical protein
MIFPTSNEEGNLHATAGKPQSLPVEGFTIRLSTPLNHSNLDFTTITTQLRGEMLLFGLLELFSITYDVLGIF